MVCVLFAALISPTMTSSPVICVVWVKLLVIETGLLYFQKAVVSVLNSYF